MLVLNFLLLIIQVCSSSSLPNVNVHNNSLILLIPRLQVRRPGL
jgi:hypothetical protein